MSGFFTAPSIAWGPGALDQLNGLGAHRPLVAIDPHVARSDPARAVQEELEKGGASVTVEVVPERPYLASQVDALAARFTASSPDWIVAVGGGATLDAVRAARLRYESPEIDWASLSALASLPEPPRSQLVAIPTTSGSGQDASAYALLERADGAPIELAHRALLPRWTLLDPVVARSVPAPIAAETAFEIVGQAIEAFTSAWANPFSDALALEAVQRTVRHWPRPARRLEDDEGRPSLHYAATAAGLAASNAQLGLAHAFAAALRGPTRLSYGRLYAIALPPVVEYSFPSARDRYETIVGCLLTPDGGRPDVAERLAELRTAAELPATLADAGVAPDALADHRRAIVRAVLASPSALANPRVPAPADVERLLDRIASGSRSGEPP